MKVLRLDPTAILMKVLRLDTTAILMKVVRLDTTAILMKVLRLDTTAILMSSVTIHEHNMVQMMSPRFTCCPFMVMPIHGHT